MLLSKWLPRGRELVQNHAQEHGSGAKSSLGIVTDVRTCQINESEATSVHVKAEELLNVKKSAKMESTSAVQGAPGVLETNQTF